MKEALPGRPTEGRCGTGAGLNQTPPPPPSTCGPLGTLNFLSICAYCWKLHSFLCLPKSQSLLTVPGLGTQRRLIPSSLWLYSHLSSPPQLLPIARSYTSASLYSYQGSPLQMKQKRIFYIINGRGESSISHDLNFAEPRQIPRKVTLHRNDHG